MARKPLIDYDGSWRRTHKTDNSWMKRNPSDTPLPEPTPIIFPEGTTREDVYPSDRKYHGD